MLFNKIDFPLSVPFFYLFGLKYRDLLSKLLLVSIAVVATAIFTYYGIGHVQFGYRYSLDFLPFLFFLLIRNYYADRRQLSPGFKKIIILSALANGLLIKINESSFRDFSPDSAIDRNDSAYSSSTNYFFI